MASSTTADVKSAIFTTLMMRFPAFLSVFLWLLDSVMGSSNSSSIPVDDESDGSMMRGLLAGLGGFVGLIVFICLLWCCCCSDDSDNNASCKCDFTGCFSRCRGEGKKTGGGGHSYQDHGPGHDPARPPRHAKDKSKVNPSPSPEGNLRAPSQWSYRP